jgi:prolipoprotein diacylglyceryltransferase
MRPLEMVTLAPWSSFVLLAVAVGFLLAWKHGRALGAPRDAWLVVLALVATAGVAGARLLHFDAAAPSGARTILGAVLLATIVLLAAVRALRLDPRTADAFALALPVGFAAGRIGCLLAGCCYGHPTDAAWGAIYDAQSGAFGAQLAAGLVGADAAESLPVHPTQLYEAGFALLVAGAVPRLRRLARRPGSLLLSVLLALALGRLLLESFRARDIPSFAGMTQVQWLLAAVACAIALLLIRREASGRSAPDGAAVGPSRLTVTLLAMAPALILVAGGTLFSPLERLLLAIFALPPLVVLALPLLRMENRGEHALASPAVWSCAVLALLLQQQVLPSAGRQEAATDGRPEAGYPRTSWTFGLSAASSDDRETRVVGTRYDDECGPSAITDDFDLHYRIGGASVAQTRNSAPGRSRTIRLRGFAGTERATPVGTPERGPVSTSVGGLGATLTLDRRMFGAAGGLGAGRFSGDSAHTSVVPTLAVRMGDLGSIHAFAGVNDMEPLGRHGSDVRVGVGYGFGNTGSAVRLGVWRGDQAFVGGTLAVSGFLIEPSVSFGGRRDMRLGISRVFGERALQP